jgi:mycothiol system anti-sigma-R factor
MSCGKPHETPCTEVLERVYGYLDAELGDVDCAKIRQHLDECGPCLREYGLEEAVKRLVAKHCGCDPAPADLRAKILVRIREVRATIEFAELGPLRADGSRRSAPEGHRRRGPGRRPTATQAIKRSPAGSPAPLWSHPFTRFAGTMAIAAQVPYLIAHCDYAAHDLFTMRFGPARSVVATLSLTLGDIRRAVGSCTLGRSAPCVHATE